MKRKLQFILALLCLAVNSAWANWEGGTYTATANETINGTINGTINVNDDATLTINSGKTVTVNKRIVIADGKTLTITGGGTLVVKASNGSNGTNGSDGAAGGDAIAGNVIIKGANVKAYGGNGGKGGKGGNGADGADSSWGDGDDGGNGGWGGWGGNGGAAFTGAVTIYSGSIEAYGGKGGNGGNAGNGGKGGNSYFCGYEDPETFYYYPDGIGGNGGDGGSGGIGGTGGTAFAGTLTVYGGNVKALGGEGGEGGQGGPESEYGAGGAYGEGPGGLGSEGSYGGPGEAGSNANAYANDITFNTTTYTMNGGFDEYIYSNPNPTEVRYVSITAPHVVYMTANLANGAYWTTFYNNTGHFIAPEGTQVFAVNLEGTTITMIPIEDRIVNAGQGVVLKQATTSSEATTTIVMTGTSSGGTGNFNNNSLEGTMGGITTDGVNNYYVLGYSQQAGVGFYKLGNGGTIGANKLRKRKPKCLRPAGPPCGSAHEGSLYR